MKTIFRIKNIKRPRNKSVVAIGVFDGVHRGHAAIIKRTMRWARRSGGEAVVLTFDPHPLHTLHPKGKPPRIMSLAHKLRIFEELEVDRCVVIRFNRRFSNLSPERFVKGILVDRLNAARVVVGDNFVFGNGQKGSPATLKRLGRRYDFSVESIKPVKAGSRVISSSHIRHLISMGDLSAAARLLGRPVSVLGTVIHGDKRGRIIGYPTANINPHHESIPRSGVYAVKIKLQNKLFNGILNIGRCPTFKPYKDAEPTIEVHIFNFKRTIYGRDLEIFFVKEIRRERHFADKQDLIRQIRSDAKKARISLSAER